MNMKENTRATQPEIDEFTQSYLAAAMWTTTQEDDEHTCDKFADDVREEVEEDCIKFLEQNYTAIIAGDIGQATLHLMNENGMPRWQAVLSAAGYDFWMTRNGHGVGFWETPDWPEEVGAKLTEACEAFGEVDYYQGEDHTLERC